jgi:DMSO/TMAO reductase YedYZ molybdopterin-dependent catalytic subunit
MTIAMLATLILAQASGPITVDLLPFDQAALKGMDQAEVRVSEEGQTVVYSGVPLAAILAKTSKDSGTMPGLRSLSDAVLLVRGTDGYQVAVSAVAVAMDTKGERFLLAIGRDGKPIGESQGPVRLIVPGDPKHARWVRNVAAIRLVRLDKVVGGS